MVDTEMVTVVSRREQLLAALTEPRHKRDLVEELDLSRSTLDRAIRELDALGLIEREDGYGLTVTGRLVLERFRGLLADFDDIAAAKQLLGALSRDAPMSVSMLRGAEVRLADQHTQPQVLEPVTELFDRAEEVRGFSVAETNPEFSEGPRGSSIPTASTWRSSSTARWSSTSGRTTASGRPWSESASTHASTPTSPTGWAW